MSRTCSTSSIQREVIQAHGHRGSNQKSAVSVTGCLPSTRRMAPVVYDEASVAK